jgi:hypothetical protein
MPGVASSINNTATNMSDGPSNVMKGRDSWDSTSTGALIPFFNRNSSQFPTEVTAPRFDLVPVTKQKDLMLNTARMHAQQEYDRIMELVSVLERQAQAIKRRLDITDMVHGAEFSFQLYPGKRYWLVQDQRRARTILTPMGPNDWSTAAPTHYQYLAQVQYQGDSTWMEVE